MLDELIIGEGCWCMSRHVIKTTSGWVIIEGEGCGEFFQIPDDYPAYADNATWVRRIDSAIDTYGDEPFYEKKILGCHMIVCRGKLWLDGYLMWDARDDEPVNWLREAEECGSVDRFIKNIQIGALPIAEQIGLVAYAAANKVPHNKLDEADGRWEFLRIWDNWQENDVGYRLLKFGDMLCPENVNQYKTITLSEFKSLQREARRRIKEGVVNEDTHIHLTSVVKGQVPFGWSIR